MSIHLLAIETSTDACSVAISNNRETIESYAVLPKQHTHNILGMLDELIAKIGLHFSQIDVLAFGRGPGSFTGLRIAASVVQALALAWDRPVVPVSTLLALAQGGYRRTLSHEFDRSTCNTLISSEISSNISSFPQVTHIFSCLDARMGEVYAGFYKFSLTESCMVPTAEEFLISPEKIEFPVNTQWLGIGSGCKAFSSIFEQKKEFLWFDKEKEIYPSAYDVAELALPLFLRGYGVPAEEALPVYFRDGVV